VTDAIHEQDRSNSGFIVIRSPKALNVDARILAYWLMYCRAPGSQTALGEPVDLGEIGDVREKNWNRLTPYSPSEPLR